MKKLYFSVFFVIFLYFLAHSITSEDVYSEASKKFENKNYKETIELLDFLNKKFPKSSWQDAAYYLKGMSYFKLGNLKKARESFSYLVKNFDNSPLIADAYYYIGKTYEMEKNIKKMFSYYKYFIINFPNSYYVINANEDLKKYSGKKYKTDELLYDVALEFHLKNMTEEAKDYYKTVINNYKNSKYYYASCFMLAKIYMDENDYKNAIKYLKVCTENKNDYYEKALFELAEIYFDSSNYVKAILTYKKIIDENLKNSSEAYYMLGEIYLILGNREKAIDVLNDLLRKYPNSVWNEKVIKMLKRLGVSIDKEILVKIKAKKEKEKKKKSGFDTVRKKLYSTKKTLYKNDKEKLLEFSKYYKKALEYEKKQKYFFAIKYYEKALEYNEDATELYLKLAFLYNQFKSFKDFNENIKTYFQKGGKADAFIYNLIAYAFYKNNKVEEAIKYYSKSLKCKNVNPIFKEETKLAIERIKMVYGI